MQIIQFTVRMIRQGEPTTFWKLVEPSWHAVDSSHGLKLNFVFLSVIATIMGPESECPLSPCSFSKFILSHSYNPIVPRHFQYPRMSFQKPSACRHLLISFYHATLPTLISMLTRICLSCFGLVKWFCKDYHEQPGQLPGWKQICNVSHIYLHSLRSMLTCWFYSLCAVNEPLSCHCWAGSTAILLQYSTVTTAQECCKIHHNHRA